MAQGKGGRMTPEEKATAIQMLGAGQSTRTVAKAIGKSQTAIVRLAQKNKDKIESESSRLVAALPDIISNIVRDIKTSAKLSKIFSKTCKTDEEFEQLYATMPSMLAHDASVLKKFMELNQKTQTDVLRTLGVFPSNTQSVFIENLFQSGSQAIIQPRVFNILAEHIKKSIESGIEIVESEEPTEEGR